MRFFKIAIAAAAIGLVVGILTLMLSMSVDVAFTIFQRWPWLAFVLPLAGVISVAWYRFLKVSLDEGTASVIEASRRSEPVPALLAPAIFLGTCLTVVCGGSVGKEAAALQLGGSVASSVGPRLGLRSKEYQETFVMCGLAAALSAVLFTPVASFVFTVEVMHRRFPHPLRLAAVAASSFVAYLTARLLQDGLLAPTLGGAADGGIDAVTVLVLGVSCAAVGGAFCVSLKKLRQLLSKTPFSALVRIGVGGALIALLVGVAGMDVYSGTGIIQIERALSGGSLDDGAFLGKFALTLLTLSFGFKGGEVMPVLCIGACLGATLASAMHADVALMAALGMVAMFSACTNCPLASCVLGVELFGFGVAPLCAGVAVIAFVFSYRCSLFQSACIDWTPRGMVRQLRVRLRHRGWVDEPPANDA